MAFDPRFMDIESWSALTASVLRKYGQIQGQANEETWHDMADAIRSLPIWGPADIPDPKNFDDWREWAAHVYDAETRIGL